MRNMLNDSSMNFKITSWREEYLNKITCGDCLEHLKNLPDNSIDLIVTDPPYGINIASSGKVGGSKGFGGKKLSKEIKAKDYNKQIWDNEIPSKEIFKEMFRVSKNQIIFGGNYFIEYLNNTSCFIVWDKQNSGNFADCELAWTSFKTATRLFKFKWNGMLQGDMKNKEKRFHPTQKPQKLMQWIIKNYAKEGDIICDPFIGSGSTAVACKELSFDYIGFEISPEYCKIVEQRLKKINNKKLKSFFPLN